MVVISAILQPAGSVRLAATDAGAARPDWLTRLATVTITTAVPATISTPMTMTRTLRARML